MTLISVLTAIWLIKSSAKPDIWPPAAESFEGLMRVAFLAAVTVKQAWLLQNLPASLLIKGYLRLQQLGGAACDAASAELEKVSLYVF